MHKSILGGSENGQWMVEKDVAAAQAELKMEDTSKESDGGEFLLTL